MVANVGRLNKHLAGSGQDKVLQIKPYGDWTKVLRNIEDLPKDVLTGYIRAQETALNRLVKIVKGHIYSQDLPGFSKKKKRVGRHLIDTSSYVTSIKTWRENFTYYAGVKSGVNEPKSKIQITKLAHMLEFGTKKMQAMPVWGPSWKEFGGIKELERIVTEAIYNRFRTRGW